PGSPPGSPVGWAAYPAGVAWALRQAGYLGGGADVAINADLPAGAGLSSSAALECSVALALTELYQVPVPRRELAALARRAENEFAGVPTGIMDQLAAFMGQAGHALAVGERRTTSHRSLRDEFRMSWPQADAAVEAAIGAGAAGARMTGGGFGGSVVALMPADRVRQVRAAVISRFTGHQWPVPRY